PHENQQAGLGLPSIRFCCRIRVLFYLAAFSNTNLFNPGRMNHGDGLHYTGRLFGGITEDIKRKIPYYLSDFRDGLHSKVAGTTLFLYFAAIANAIAFGALSGLYTGNQIGIMEMLVATAVGGIF